ncbi:MAG: 6-pyruvoyl tetrahydropterin synthase family protein [Thermoplasmata archaeon]
MKLEIDGWKSRIGFSASHIVPTSEKCERLHGHDYAVHVKIKGEPDSSGMIMDFIVLKRALREVTEELDHRVLLPARSPHMKIEEGETIRVIVGEKSYSFPPEDVRILDIRAASAEHLARFILKRLTEEIDLPANVRKIKIGVDEGPGQGAWASVSNRPA